MKPYICIYICECLPFGFFQVVACSLKSKYMLNLHPTLRNPIRPIVLYRCKFRRNSWCWFGIENRALVLKLSRNGKAYRVQYKERTSVVFGQVRFRANETWSIKWEHVPMYTHNDWQLVSFCVTFLDMCRYIAWRWFFFSRFDGCYFGSLFFFYPQRTTSNWFDGLIWIYVEDTLIWTRYYGVEYTMIALIDEKSVVKPCFISEKHQWISYTRFSVRYVNTDYIECVNTQFGFFCCSLVSIAIKCRKYGLYKWESEHIHTQIHTRTHAHTSPTLIDSIHNANSVYYCHQHGFTHTNTHIIHFIFEMFVRFYRFAVIS